MSLADQLARLPGARVRRRGDEVRVVFEHDGCWLDARGRDTTSTEVYVRTIDLDFMLRIRPSGEPVPVDLARRWIQTSEGTYYGIPEDEVPAAIDKARGRIDFASHCEVDSDDVALARIWIDEPIREAVPAACWLDGVGGIVSFGAQVHGYTWLLERGEVMVRRSQGASDITAGMRAAAAIAARPHRLARTWHRVAREVGGTTTGDRWIPDGDFAAVIERGPVQVRIDNVRAHDEGPWLRTRVRAREIAPDASRWAAWPEDTPRDRRPPGAGRSPDAAPLPGWAATTRDPEPLAARLKPAATALAGAQPVALWAKDGEIALWLDHLVLDPARLRDAVDVIARLAVDTAIQTGPYR